MLREDDVGLSGAARRQGGGELADGLVDQRGIGVGREAVGEDIARGSGGDVGGGQAHLVDGGLFRRGDPIDRHLLASARRGFRLGSRGGGHPDGFGLRALQQLAGILDGGGTACLGIPQHRLGFAAEARGFILGGALARELEVGFVPARKPGKLPHETISAEYALEYGVDALEVHRDALSGGALVLVHDDLLATGGTARALCDLAGGLGARVVGCAFLVELGFLGARARLSPHSVFSLIDFGSE